MVIEKRQEKRIGKENRVQITISKNYEIHSHQRIFYRLTKDISEHGMKIISDTFVPKGVIFRIRLCLKDPHRIIRINGEVRWTRSLFADERFETGLKFVDESLNDAKILKEYIENISEEDHLWHEFKT
ncbi:PilZ domain-containing protein [Acidobacteriota bacterium]